MSGMMAPGGGSVAGTNITPTGITITSSAGTTGTTNALTNGLKLYFAAFTNGTTTTITLPGSPASGWNFTLFCEACNGTSTLTTSGNVFRNGDPNTAVTVITPNPPGNHRIYFEYTNGQWYFNDDIYNPGVVINAQTGASYSLALTDANNMVTMNNAGANTVTVTKEATVTWPPARGTQILIQQIGAGVTTIAADAGVTINAPGGLVIPKQWASVVLINTASNVWTVSSAVASQVAGTATNDNAAAGFVGEQIQTLVASGAAVSLTTVTPTNLASVSLTAGDWDVRATFIYIPGATTSITQLSQGISQSTGALPTTTTGAGDYTVFSQVAAVPGANNISQTINPVRVSLSATTTVYAVARPTFTVSTLTVYGNITARRVR